MSRPMLSIILGQVSKYKKIGFKAGGSFLKHSLYPLKYFKQILPSSGTILDFGCGEGMLTNLLAELLPGAEFHGIDLDSTKIKQAKVVAGSDTHFVNDDIKNCKFAGASAVIFNDVLHHHSNEDQLDLLKLACTTIDRDGLVVLKEVDLGDKLDVAWTTFWDKKLYPKDKLNFRRVSDWQKVLKQVGLRVVDIHKVKHPWPASRTIIVATKKPKLDRVDLPDVLIQDPKQLTKVLVTGATGFIGEHLVRELLLNGIDGKKAALTLIVRDIMDLHSDLRELANLKIIVTDLNNIKDQSIIGQLEEYEYVFHLASRVAFFAGKKILEENIRPTQNLISILRRTKLKRFVFTSTMGAFDRKKGDDCRAPLDENSLPYPVSFYGKSKLECEKIVKGSGLPYTIIRIPWCYGPGMSKTHHVRVLFEGVMKGGLAYRFNWPGKVSIIEAGALANILSRVAYNPKAENEAFFISDSTPISFGELFSEMGKAAGKKAGNINIPFFIIWLIKHLRVFIPFQIKSLCMDVLAVSNKKISKVMQDIPDRKPDFLLPLARYINEQKYFSRHRSFVLITGAASGIGKALAKQFYSSGYSSILIDKDSGPLMTLSEQLKTEGKAMDLADQARWKELSDYLLSRSKNTEIVINNAGVGARGNFWSLGIESIQQIIKVNCMVPVLIDHLFIAAFMRARRGTIVNIASSAAFQPLPYMAIYSASKSFILNFSEAVTGEISRDKNNQMEIITISPSGTSTGFQASAGVKRSGNESLLSPEYVASKIVSAIGKGSRSIIIGRSGKIMSFIARIMPQKMRIRLWEHLMKEKR